MELVEDVVALGQEDSRGIKLMLRINIADAGRQLREKVKKAEFSGAVTVPIDVKNMPGSMPPPRSGSGDAKFLPS